MLFSNKEKILYLFSFLKESIANLKKGIENIKYYLIMPKD